MANGSGQVVGSLYKYACEKLGNTLFDFVLFFIPLGKFICKRWYLKSYRCLLKVTPSVRIILGIVHNTAVRTFCGCTTRMRLYLLIQNIGMFDASPYEVTHCASVLPFDTQSQWDHASIMCRCGLWVAGFPIFPWDSIVLYYTNLKDLKEIYVLYRYIGHEASSLVWVRWRQNPFSGCTPMMESDLSCLSKYEISDMAGRVEDCGPRCGVKYILWSSNRHPHRHDMSEISHFT